MAGFVVGNDLAERVAKNSQGRHGEQEADEGEFPAFQKLAKIPATVGQAEKQPDAREKRGGQQPPMLPDNEACHRVGAEGEGVEPPFGGEQQHAQDKGKVGGRPAVVPQNQKGHGQGEQGAGGGGEDDDIHAVSERSDGVRLS